MSGPHREAAMNSLDKRRLLLATGGLAVVASYSLSGPIADIRVTHVIADTSIARLETRIDLGVIAFSYFHSWKRVLP
jgi:hypothetical protein